MPIKQRAAPLPAPSKGAKERLLAAATQIFASHGFEGATTREITKAAKVNISAIPYYFGDKKGLYRAVIQQIADLARTQIAKHGTFITEILASPRATKNDYKEALQDFIKVMAAFLMGGAVSPEMSRIFVREQMDPTESFALIYDDVMRPIHEALTKVFAKATGLPYPSDKATLATHALMGQIIVFKTHREAVLRRLSWKKVGPDEIEKIVETVSRHVAFIVTMYQEPPSRRRG